VLPGSTSTQSSLAAAERDRATTRLAEGSEVGRAALLACMHAVIGCAGRAGGGALAALAAHAHDLVLALHALAVDPAPNVDRKSTRLNSSHFLC
jgi:hypothetical protein